jgi:hypothetical protein
MQALRQSSHLRVAAPDLMLSGGGTLTSGSGGTTACAARTALTLTTPFRRRRLYRGPEHSDIDDRDADRLAQDVWRSIATRDQHMLMIYVFPDRVWWGQPSLWKMTHESQRPTAS